MRYFIFLIAICLFNSLAAQDSIRYTPATDLMIVGKTVNTVNPYTRIDSTTEVYNRFPPAVKRLSYCSAGIAILFETNSSTLKIKWKQKTKMYMANMTPIAHSGFDLYALNTNGKWQYVSVGKPKDTTVNEDQLMTNMNGEMKQFMLYLPLFNEPVDLQIGTVKSSSIKKPAKPAIDTNISIAMYGSSILHGASASRAGMAYPAILSRKTGFEIFNLGFSGNAKMELPLAEFLATLDPTMYILDCIPNPSPEEIHERAYPFIKHLLTKKPGIPILLIETIYREAGNWDYKIAQKIKQQNEEIGKAYQRLKSEGYQNLYYLPGKDLMGSDHEATIDGTHLTDLGFMRQADIVLGMIQKILASKIKK